MRLCLFVSFCLSIYIYRLSFFSLRSYHRYLTMDDTIFILLIAQLTQILNNRRHAMLSAPMNDSRFCSSLRWYSLKVSVPSQLCASELLYWPRSAESFSHLKSEAKLGGGTCPYPATFELYFSSICHPLTFR